MRPILKWPGGKRREHARLEPLLRDPGRWVEPFLGGGALCFAAEPDRALLGDVVPELIAFYRAIGSGDAAVAGAMRALAADRDTLLDAARAGAIALDTGAPARVALDAARAARPASVLLADPALGRRLETTLAAKRRRLAALAAAAPFPDDDRRAQLVTALSGGLYAHVRDTDAASPAEAVARFWFIRELAYGSLFRENAAGRSNVPYGGASYDRRALVPVAESVLGPGPRALLGRAALRCADFRAVLDELGPGEPDDLVVADPPYDSPFSSYAGRAFDLADHAALRERLLDLRCRFVLIVGASPRIEALWADDIAAGRVEALRYAHTYASNIRGRYARAATHLVVHREP